MGRTPVANALLDSAESTESTFPLEVGFCARCTLVQLTYVLPAESIFDADYPYFSSYSDLLLAHSRDHVDRLVVDRGLGPDSLVVEIASNDGYLLRHFAAHHVPVLGIEPTPGPAAAAADAGVLTLQEFFGTELAGRLVAEGRRADVVVANNVLAHVPDLNGFVAGMAMLVAEDGLVSVENPCVTELVSRGAFDTIYHEHVCYFSTSAVQALLARHGLTLVDVQQFDRLHGGTRRWYARPGPAEMTARAERELAYERAVGATDLGYYQDFGEQVREITHDLVALLQRLRADGATVAAYGAAAKGATLLNSAGVGTDLVDFVVDRSPHKQGKLMPGARLPILSPSALRERRPDYVLVLAWNVFDEVVEQQADYVEAGGRFILPVPRPRIV